MDDDVIYLMAEMRQETDYVTHHIQKVAAFFGDESFLQITSPNGHKIKYYRITDEDNAHELAKLIKDKKPL